MTAAPDLPDATPSSPFPIRGLVEAYYGVFYTFPERNDLIRFAGQHGYNLYIYGPKNDRQHRRRWREPYPPFIMAQFAETVRLATEVGVTFCYSLGVGVAITYSAAEDFAHITTKFRAFYDIGVRSFSLLLDDIASEFAAEADRLHYKTYAEAHADLCNRVYTWLMALDPAITFSMCPTEYYGIAPFSTYLHELGERLHPAIDLFYTGPAICSREIAAEDAQGFAQAARRPPILWDNYPTNDLAMNPELHTGPLRGRDPALHTACKGMVFPPMLQPEASKIPLLTIADYLRDPAGYEPASSWRRAIEQISGESADALHTLIENWRRSPLEQPALVPIEGAIAEALAALSGPDALFSGPVERLEQYAVALDEACYHLKYRMANLALRQDLLPWIEASECWAFMAQFGLFTLRAIARGTPYGFEFGQMNEWTARGVGHVKRLRAEVMAPFADFVRVAVEVDRARKGG